MDRLELQTKILRVNSFTLIDLKNRIQQHILNENIEQLYVDCSEFELYIDTVHFLNRDCIEFFDFANASEFELKLISKRLEELGNNFFELTAKNMCENHYHINMDSTLIDVLYNKQN